MRSVLALVAVIAVLGVRVDAQDFFYEAYQSGIREFKAGNLESARRLFEHALKLDPRQSRRKLFYGRLFEEYLPEYYLAQISVREKQPDRARAYLQNLERAGLLKPGDPQHAALTAQLNAATPAVAANAPAKPTSTPPRAPETPPSTAETGAGRGNASEPTVRSAENTTPAPATEKPAPLPPSRVDPVSPGPARTENAKPAASTTSPAASSAGSPAPKAIEVDWQKVTTDVNRLLDAGEFERAWDANRRAAAAGSTGGEAASLSKRIVDRVARTAETRLRERNVAAAGKLLATLDRMAAGSPDAQRLRSAIEVQVASAPVERESLRNLVLGNYQRVVELTAPLVDGRRASARVLFYAACARAGLSLMGARESDALRTEARRIFAAATSSRADFKKEEALLSPEIFGVLRTP